MTLRAAILLGIVMICGASGWSWADQPPDPAGRAVSLFMQGCIGALGDMPALRSWVEHAGLPEVPSDRADEFLNGLPGAAYDASAGQLALVLVAQDDGSCSVVMDNANGPDLVRDLEQTMRAENITFTPTDDPSDPQTKDLNNREYAATKDNRRWHMLVSTVKNAAGGPAMLTSNP